MNTVSQNLKRIRIEKGLTQRQMAEKLFVTQQTISNWEKGKAMPAVDRLEDIAQKLEVSSYDLLYGFDQDKEKLKRKMKYSAVISIVFFILWQLLADKAWEMDYYKFDKRLTMLIALVLRPVVLFMFTYALVMFYRTKVKTLPQNNLPFTKWVKIAIVVFMIANPVMVVIYFYSGLSLTGVILYQRIFLFFWKIGSKGSWVYAVLGMIYGLCDQNNEKNKN